MSKNDVIPENIKCAAFRWVDSHYRPGWNAKENVASSKHPIYCCGVLCKEDDDEIVVAPAFGCVSGELDQSDYSNSFAVPKVCIVGPIKRFTLLDIGVKK